MSHLTKYRQGLFLDTNDKEISITSNIRTFNVMDAFDLDCITGDFDSDLDGFLVLFF